MPLIAAFAAALAAASLPAPPIYVTNTHGLTFRPPAGASYCPLPDGWVGSDHGTVLFLRPPEACGGAGYSASSRAFEPQDAARIEVFYGYRSADDSHPRKRCAGLPPLILMGKHVPVCRTVGDGLERLTVEAEYAGREVVLSLVTPGDAKYGDYITFVQFVGTVRACGVADPRHACPDGGWF
jgi:hypothetical protein